MKISLFKYFLYKICSYAKKVVILKEMPVVVLQI